MTQFKAGDRIKTKIEYMNAPAGSFGIVANHYKEDDYYIPTSIPGYSFSDEDPWLLYLPGELTLLKYEETDPRDEALDRIADVLLHKWVKVSDDATYAIYKIIRETGRMQ